MRSSAARHPVGKAIWVCESNYLTCNPHAEAGEHLLRFHQTGYRADLRRVSGHAFLECKQCDPASFFFAVFTTTPSPMVTCYAISKESYEEYEKDPSATTLSTPEMLYRLRDPDGRSYNPYYRPRI